MAEGRLDNRVREMRERRELSQAALAERVGVSRQAVVAIESGRQVPSTLLGLRLAQALHCQVEDLFRLGGEVRLPVTVAPVDAAAEDGTASRRVSLAEVNGRWVAHRLPADARLAADGVLTAEPVDRSGVARPLVDVADLRRNVLVAGCAPLLGALAQHTVLHSPDAHATWIEAGSGRALDLLRNGWVHIAGVHGGGTGADGDNAALVRRALPGTKALLFNLTRWRLGLVVARNNPLGIHAGADLLRPGLRFARREQGTGAHRLMVSLAAAEGVLRPDFPGPLASGHAEVAQLVRCGAADVGVAVEGVALAAGLGFVPFVEERFDLIVPADFATHTSVARVLDELRHPAFRSDARELPGYDTESCGHVTTLEAA